jgi:DNA-binding Lrp family transcriptional regulator
MPAKIVENTVNMTELDSVDTRLLALLQDNSRASTSALARQLGVSRSTVQDRINRLERRRVIGGYTVRFHPDYGARRIRAHVLIRIDPKQAAAIEEALGAMPAVRTLQTVSGVYDLVTTVETDTTQDMDRLLDRIGALGGVEKTTSSIVLSTRLER